MRAWLLNKACWLGEEGEVSEVSEEFGKGKGPRETE